MPWIKSTRRDTDFLLLLPMIEEKLLDGKREMIQELTESAWSILSAQAQKESEGQVGRQDAQTQAIESIRIIDKEIDLSYRLYHRIKYTLKHLSSQSCF